jgi:hypothetical protein
MKVYTEYSMMSRIKDFFSGRRLVAILVVLVIAVGSSAVYFYIQYRNATTDPNAATIASVGQLIMLPSEKPTIAVVTNKSKLSGDTFFNNAKDGDKVLIYLKSKVVILYRPSINKIVAAAYGTEAQSATSAASPSSSSSSQSQDLSVAIYNGSPMTGEGTTVQQKILKSINNVTVPIVQNAKHQYSNSMVVDLTGNHTQAATQLAGFLGMSTGALPAGETNPNTNLLIIIGSDYIGG